MDLAHPADGVQPLDAVGREVRDEPVVDENPDPAVSDDRDDEAPVALPPTTDDLHAITDLIRHDSPRQR